jgi:hypothetical protein
VITNLVSMKKLIVFPILCWAVFAWSQDVVTGVEWWTSGQYENAVFSPVEPTENFEGVVPVDFSAFPIGKHEIFFRFRSISGKWSPVLTQQFTKTPAGSAVSLLTAVQFWTDDSADEIVTQAIDPPVSNYEDVLSLNLASLNTGRSSLNIRFIDSNGRWSKPLAHRIVKTPDGDDSVYMAAMEYWFNNDIDNSTWHFFDDKPTEVHATLPISLSTLDAGGHLVEIRFYNNLGQISEVHRSFVKKFPDGMEQNRIGAYRYWFDNDPLSLVQEQFSQVLAGQEGTITLSLSSFNPGDTVMVSMQFLDQTGQWSAIHSESVIVYDPTSINNREPDQVNMVLYPNPVREGAAVFIEWEPTTLPGELVIADSEGRTVMQQSVESPESGFLQLNTNALGRGVYTLTFYSGDQWVTKRLVVL